MKVERKGDWLCAQVGDELVMMSAERGCYIGLSEVGARVWALIAEPAELDAVCAALQREFDVAPDICRAEVSAFLSELAAQNAVALAPAGSA
jgi:hypothetical protein